MSLAVAILQAGGSDIGLRQNGCGDLPAPWIPGPGKSLFGAG
ncbi:MAG: hypothetical protein WAL22_06720 [Solirubrobacteraceae bacterium]